MKPPLDPILHNISSLSLSPNSSSSTSSTSSNTISTTTTPNMCSVLHDHHDHHHDTSSVLTLSPQSALINHPLSPIVKPCTLLSPPSLQQQQQQQQTTIVNSHDLSPTSPVSSICSTTSREQTEHPQHSLQFVSPLSVLKPSSQHSTNTNINTTKRQKPSSTNTTSTTTPSPSPPLNSSSPPQPPQPPSPPSHPLLDARYKLGEKLGRGCFATVYKAIRRSDNTVVAIKVIQKSRLEDDTETLLHNELQILRAVSQHPGIVTLLDHVETDTHMFFVMDYVDGGPLLDRIVSRGSFSENDARIVLRTILLTLQFLSDLGCVHRDIKPENILVDNHSKTWPLKLTDFGLSAKMQPDQKLYDALGTPLFVAPEILNGHGYDCSCDMWSLGVVIYIVLCGYPPFPVFETPKNLIDAIKHGRYSFPNREWKHVSEDAKDMLRRMLEIDPKKRITPEQALQHRWVAQVQSKTDLPNTKLRHFNAKRKLKASVVAIRTMNIVARVCDITSSSSTTTSISDEERQFGISSSSSSSTSSSASSSPTTGSSQSHEELQRDVEKSRALIKRLGIGLDGRSIARIHDGDGKSFDGELSMSNKTSRRSLVLPMNEKFLASSSIHNNNNNNNNISTEDEHQAYLRGRHNINYGRGQMMGNDADTSQFIVESRAKILVAEINQSGLLDNETNPFMDSGRTKRNNNNNSNRTSTTTQTISGTEESTPSSSPSRHPVALASLDFGLIGL